MDYILNVIVLNGYPLSGKDEFVKISKEKYYCYNHSTVDKVKEMALLMGWDGKKTDKNRKMLSEFKQFYVKWFDGPFKDIIRCIKFNKIQIETSGYDAEIPYCDNIFLHIREPEEIERIKQYCNTDNKLKFHSILIERYELGDNDLPDSDIYINNYDYDYVIDNKSNLNNFKINVLKIMKTINNK